VPSKEDSNIGNAKRMVTDDEGGYETTVEYRKHQRYPVRFKAFFPLTVVHIADGLLLDLSLGGCRLTSARHLPFRVSR